MKQSKTIQDKADVSPSVTLFVVSAVQFLTPFMASSVGVALPTIGNEFGASAVQLSMIQMAYIFAVAILLIPIGRFADIQGRKRVFIIGIILAALATFLIGWTRDTMTFLFFRFLQGVGAAMITSTSIAILSSVFPPERRRRAMGVIVACVYVGLAAGPTLAGIVTSQLGWRWLFYLMVPIQLLALFLTTIIFVMVLLGVGFGVFASPNVSAIIGSVGPSHYGAAASINATMRTVGILSSMAIITVILSLVMGDHPVTAANSLKFVHSMHASLIVYILMSLVGIGFSIARNRVAKAATLC